MLCFTLKLCDKFADAIALVQKQTKALKTSIYPHAVAALASVIAGLPPLLGVFSTQWVVNKSTMVMSNVPGPKIGLVFKGHKVTGFMVLVPGLGDLACAIGAMSLENNVFISVHADRALITDCGEVRDLLDANYDKLVSELKSE